MFLCLNEQIDLALNAKEAIDGGGCGQKKANKRKQLLVLILNRFAICDCQIK